LTFLWNLQRRPKVADAVEVTAESRPKQKPEMPEFFRHLCYVECGFVWMIAIGCLALFVHLFLWIGWGIGSSIHGRVVETIRGMNDGLEGLSLPARPTSFSSDLQILDSPERGAIRNQESSSSTPGGCPEDGRIPEAERIVTGQESTMPVVAIQPFKRMSFPYLFPSTGKVKITLEASVPVDIFVIRQSEEALASSVTEAAKHGLYTLPQRKKEEQALTLPEAWRDATWSLVIANPSPNVAAVYYMVFNA
jgi:hypothetical protein